MASGDVMHGMKASDPGFAGFGEAYFSTVNQGVTKGWKRHRDMTLNLICIDGTIRFVVYGDEPAGCLLDVTLSSEEDARYCRLTVPPMLWVAFRGLSAGRNMLLNLASTIHDPTEASSVTLDTFAWPAEA